MHPGEDPFDTAGLSLRAVRLARLGTVVAAGFREEVSEGAGILASGDVGGLGEYILSYGAWAPVASTLLMVLQALAAPLPLLS